MSSCPLSKGSVWEQGCKLIKVSAAPCKWPVSFARLRRPNIRFPTADLPTFLQFFAFRQSERILALAMSSSMKSSRMFKPQRPNIMSILRNTHLCSDHIESAILRGTVQLSATASTATNSTTVPIMAAMTPIMYSLQ